MADTKISGLPASTVPLAGTEVLPIVQSSTTKQVSIANVTAGRDVSALSVATTKDTTPSSSLGAFSYGTLTYADVNHLATFQTTVNSYAQVEIQNSNVGATASADMVVGNNNTTASTYYGDFGMNSSGWAGSGPFNTANTVYLTSTTAPLSIGTTDSNIINFATNSTTAASISTAQIFSTVNDATIHGVTVGLGGGSGNASTAIGNGALIANTAANSLTAIGYQSLNKNTTALTVGATGTVTLGGTGYTAGTYTCAQSGSGATFATYPTVTITVAGGVVQTVTVATAGVGCSTSGTITLTITSGGTGLTFTIATVSGTGNVAVGYQAGYSNTTGTSNTFNGYQAGYSNTTGVNGTYVGLSAGYNITTGANNTAIGINSLSQCQTGTGNIALGASAGYNITGSDNTAIGYLSLNSLTSNGKCIAIGGQSLYATTGSNNIGLGYQAGRGNASANANTTGSNNTYIGYQTVGSANNNTNEMVIGYTAVGLGSNTTVIGNASTTATYNGNNSATWSITSDISIKKNIVSLESCLAIISALRPVEFDYIENNKHDIGFIAQEYQTILPAQVIEQDSGLLALNQNLTPYLVKALQELNAKFDAYIALHP